MLKRAQSIQQQRQRCLREQEPATGLRVISRRVFLLAQFEEGFAHEATARVEYRGRQGRVGEEFFRDLVKGGFQAGRIRDVGADAVSLAAGGVDILDDALVVGRVTCEDNHGIGFGESTGNGRSLSVR